MKITDKIKKINFKLIFRFLKLLYPYRKIWIFVPILSGLSSLLGLVNPYISKLVVDKAIGNKDFKLFITLAIIGGAVFIANAVLDNITNFIDRYIKMRVGFDLNRKIYRKIQNLSLNWFKDKSTGEHLYKISYDVDRVNDFITNGIPQAISIFPRLIFTLIIVCSLNWKMALFSFLLAPILYLPSYYFSKKMRNIWNTMIENFQDIFKYLSEMFYHIHLVKAFGKEASSIRGHLKRLINNIRISTKNMRLEFISSFTSQVLSKVLVSAIAFYGIYQVIKGPMSFGTFTAIMMYVGQLMGLQGQFAHFFQTFVLGMVSCERLGQVLDEKIEVSEKKEAQALIFHRPKVTFKNISFGYSKDEYILRRLSFNIEEGKHIALVGPSGCGKTTILNLILRLYDPWEGEILIDNHNIKDLKLNSLRSQIGIALQEPFLWNDTVENNIRYGRDDAQAEEIIQTARLIGVDDFVKELPLGYKSIVGENACKLSEGQKQKIAIARALIRRPKIMILDEATSSMDSASEAKIIPNIKNNHSDLILITASHRLSTVMSADLVYYLKSAQEIVIDAPHNLLLRDADFINLFTTQNIISVGE